MRMGGECEIFVKKSHSADVKGKMVLIVSSKVKSKVFCNNWITFSSPIHPEHPQARLFGLSHGVCILEIYPFVALSRE